MLRLFACGLRSAVISVLMISDHPTFIGTCGLPSPRSDGSVCHSAPWGVCEDGVCVSGNDVTLPSPSPSCTEQGHNPFASGQDVPCCEGLEPCLGAVWVSSGAPEYFTCETRDNCSGEATAAPTSLPPGQCTTQDADPWETGEEVPCCNGLESCL